MSNAENSSFLAVRAAKWVARQARRILPSDLDDYQRQTRLDTIKGIGITAAVITVVGTGGSRLIFGQPHIPLIDGPEKSDQEKNLAETKNKILAFEKERGNNMLWMSEHSAEIRNLAMDYFIVQNRMKAEDADKLKSKINVLPDDALQRKMAEFDLPSDYSEAMNYNEDKYYVRRKVPFGRQVSVSEFFLDTVSFLYHLNAPTMLYDAPQPDPTGAPIYFRKGLMIGTKDPNGRNIFYIEVWIRHNLLSRARSFTGK